MTKPKMITNLSGVLFKVSLADKRLRGLYEARDGLIKDKGDGVVGHFNAKRGEYIFRVPGPLPSPALGVEVGVIAHLWRSALDNIIWLLVKARGNTPNDWYNKFPIYEAEAQFIEAVPRKRGSPELIPRGERDTMGVSSDDFAAIKGFQPYQLGLHRTGESLAQTHPLSLLSYLNNTDKHQTVTAGWAAVAVGIPMPPDPPFMPIPTIRPVLISSPYYRLRVPDGPVYGWPVPQSRDGSVQVLSGKWLFSANPNDPAEILRITNVKALGPDPKMDMKPSPAIEVAFGDWKRPVTLWDLNDIRIEVGKVLGTFIDAIG